MRKLKVYATIKEHVQLTKITKLPAVPFTLMGNIWKKKIYMNNIHVLRIYYISILI